MKSNEIIYEGNVYDYILVRGKPRYRINKKLAAKGILPNEVMSGFIKRQNLPQITKKQKVFVEELIKNPKMSGTQAALKAYGKPDKPINNGTAEVIAYENLRKPQIISHLEAYSDLAENTITETIIRYRKSDSLEEVKEATSNARWLHDKVHGKAKQVNENTNINIDFMEALRNLK